MAGEGIVGLITQLAGISVPVLINVIENSVASNNHEHLLSVLEILGPGLRSQAEIAIREDAFRKSVGAG